MSKFVIFTGGLVSNVGKGTAVASLGRVLKNRGLKVTMQKFDQYLNVDPGTMSPYQHGEVFVTDDGAETSLDIGHYERFMDISLGTKNNVTSGRLYTNVINKERMGKYLGTTVSVVPNITNEIKSSMKELDNDENDIVIIEIGGNTNDYESVVYYRAIREFIIEKGRENVFLAHIDLLPFMPSTRETKIECIQTSVSKLNDNGLFPNAVVCRTIKNLKLAPETKKRIAVRCFLNGPECVIQNPDVDTLYEIPLTLQKEGLDSLIVKHFGLESQESDLNSWSFMVNNFKGSYPEVRICIVGKYTKVPNAYISIEEAIKHAAMYNQVKAKIEMIDAEDVAEYGPENLLRGAKGIIIPPAWGSKGVEGMILATQYARENKIAFLGIEMGMQIAVIEFARHVLGYPKANSTEFDAETKYPVVVELDELEEQKRLASIKDSFRSGAFDCKLSENSRLSKLYGTAVISERHRHRYELNLMYSEKFEQNGLKFVGVNPESGLVDIVEYKGHPFFYGTIFDPQFKSRPNKPHPIFLGFMNTAKSVR